MEDLIRRSDAQKRRYTFGNDEFSLEAAYHDCKLVFDGIADDDSFQEADTELILYYANEIIYALHKALEDKDTSVLGNDSIRRKDAIEYFMTNTNWYDEDGNTIDNADEKRALLTDYFNGVPSAKQWIPCSERLPEEEDEEYLTTEMDLSVHITRWKNGKWLNGWVLAWMPLPEPYKAESEDKLHRKAGTPREGYEPLYNCENWIP